MVVAKAQSECARLLGAGLTIGSIAYQLTSRPSHSEIRREGIIKGLDISLSKKGQSVGICAAF